MLRLLQTRRYFAVAAHQITTVLHKKNAGIKILTVRNLFCTKQKIINYQHKAILRCNSRLFLTCHSREGWNDKDFLS